LILSLLWHGLLILLFNSLFEIESTPKAIETVGILEVSIENDKPSIIEVSQKKKISKLEPEVKTSDKAIKLKANNTRLPKIKKIKSRNYDDKRIKKSVIKSGKPKDKSEVAHTEHPFSIVGELKKRKILSSPELPKYPKWALEADVELKCKIALIVEKSGTVKRAWVLEPSGDSHTDNDIITFIENLEFEEKPYLSKDEINWEFKLKF
jgi:outer membrane biosynthesis protein TonB